MLIKPKGMLKGRAMLVALALSGSVGLTQPSMAETTFRLAIPEDVVRAALAARPRLLLFLEDGFAGRDAVKRAARAAGERAGVPVRTR